MALKQLLTYLVDLIVKNESPLLKIWRRGWFLIFLAFAELRRQRIVIISCLFDGSISYILYFLLFDLFYSKLQQYSFGISEPLDKGWLVLVVHDLNQ